MSWRLWLAPDFTWTRGSKHLTSSCVWSLLESGFGLGTFLSREIQPLSQKPILKNCLFSLSWLQIFLHFKAHFYSPECFICQCAIISTFNWIIHYDDMPVHIYHTVKFVSASLTHSSFNSPLIHWVIWRTNIPCVCEREKGEYAETPTGIQVKTHCYTFCPHRIMVRHPQYVAYFSHRHKIKVLRTEKCTECIPLPCSHEDPDVIGTDHPSSRSLQDHDLVWKCSDLFFKWSLNETFLEIIQSLLEQVNRKKSHPHPQNFLQDVWD